MPPRELDAHVDTVHGRVTFKVYHDDQGNVVLPRGAEISSPDGRVIGRVMNDTPIHPRLGVSFGANSDRGEFIEFAPTAMHTSRNMPMYTSMVNFTGMFEVQGSRMPRWAIPLTQEVKVAPQPPEPPKPKRAVDRLLDDEELV